MRAWTLVEVLRSWWGHSCETLIPVPSSFDGAGHGPDSCTRLGVRQNVTLSGRSRHALSTAIRQRTAILERATVEDLLNCEWLWGDVQQAAPKGCAAFEVLLDCTLRSTSCEGHVVFCPMGSHAWWCCEGESARGEHVWRRPVVVAGCVDPSELRLLGGCLATACQIYDCPEAGPTRGLTEQCSSVAGSVATCKDERWFGPAPETKLYSQQDRQMSRRSRHTTSSVDRRQAAPWWCAALEDLQMIPQWWSKWEGSEDRGVDGWSWCASSSVNRGQIAPGWRAVHEALRRTRWWSGKDGVARATSQWKRQHRVWNKLMKSANGNRGSNRRKR